MAADPKINVSSQGQTGGVTAAQVIILPSASSGPQMSADALEYMKRLAVEYVKWEFPNHRVWNFDTGADDALHNELRALGFIKLMGTRGAPWVLTDAGQRWIMENRP